MSTIVLVLTTPLDDVDPLTIGRLLEHVLRHETSYTGCKVFAADFKGPLPEWAGGAPPRTDLTPAEAAGANTPPVTAPRPHRPSNKRKSILQQLRERKKKR